MDRDSGPHIVHSLHEAAYLITRGLLLDKPGIVPSPASGVWCFRFAEPVPLVMLREYKRGGTVPALHYVNIVARLHKSLGNAKRGVRRREKLTT